MPKYQRILVPVDGSPVSNQGLAEAIALAGLTGAQLRLLHVVDETSFAISADVGQAYAGDLLGLLREGGQAILDKARATVLAAGIACDTALRDSLAGRVCDIVTDEARDWQADLLVIGTHGRRGVGRLVLGSDAEQILRQAPVPVLLVRGAAPAA